MQKQQKLALEKTIQSIPKINLMSRRLAGSNFETDLTPQLAVASSTIIHHEKTTSDDRGKINLKIKNTIKYARSELPMLLDLTYHSGRFTLEFSPQKLPRKSTEIETDKTDNNYLKDILNKMKIHKERVVHTKDTVKSNNFYERTVAWKAEVIKKTQEKYNRTESPVPLPLLQSSPLPHSNINISYTIGFNFDIFMRQARPVMNYKALGLVV